MLQGHVAKAVVKSAIMGADLPVGVEHLVKEPADIVTVTKELLLFYFLSHHRVSCRVPDGSGIARRLMVSLDRFEPGTVLLPQETLAD
jgi:hypothetical protein